MDASDGKNHFAFPFVAPVTEALHIKQRTGDQEEKVYFVSIWQPPRNEIKTPRGRQASRRRDPFDKRSTTVGK